MCNKFSCCVSYPWLSSFTECLGTIIIEAHVLQNCRMTNAMVAMGLCIGLTVAYPAVLCIQIGCGWDIELLKGGASEGLFASSTMPRVPSVRMCCHLPPRLPLTVDTPDNMPFLSTAGGFSSLSLTASMRSNKEGSGTTQRALVNCEHNTASCSTQYISKQSFTQVRATQC